MIEQQTKNRFMMLEAMLAIVLLIFLAAFALDKFLPTPTAAMIGGDTPQIVGFVPVEIKSQPIDLDAKTSTSFIVFSEKEAEFALTSLRLSGEVIGEGRAEIVLDNGLGQELAIYSNIKQKEGNMITGMSVSDEPTQLPENANIEDVPAEQAWFKITPSENPLAETPRKEVSDDKRTISGKFQYECGEACYMSMKMRKGLFYTLKVRLDAGTEVKINELKYTLEV
jgi:hypothetical protein